jgi:predicted nucleotidyltransferase
MKSALKKRVAIIIFLMVKKSITQKVLSVFFENPSRTFHLRELSRLLRKSLPTVMTATDELAKEQLITKTKGSVMTTLTANRDKEQFIRKKRLYNLESIYESGLLEALKKAYNNPKTIVLFGSFSRGEDIEKSDIDIAVNTSKKPNATFQPSEAKLKRPVSVHPFEFDHLNTEFRTNLMNGLVLEGSW